MSDLTPRQTEILRLIQRAINETGMPPTRAEIANELGFKTEFGGKLRLNGAVFHSIYSDLQVAVPVPIVGSGSFGTVVANAGFATHDTLWAVTGLAENTRRLVTGDGIGVTLIATGRVATPSGMPMAALLPVDC